MAKPLPGIEHVIVLMFENRSFDNVLGGLYPDKTKKGTYRGLLGNETNPLNPRNVGGRSVTVFQGPAAQSTWIMPYPDPGEEYSDMVQQIFGSYSVPSGGSPAPMSGFAWNYSVQPWSISGEGWPARAPVPEDIMQYYSGDTMPATYALAQAFAVCDCWFAAAPVQTIANRVLAHCGTPSKMPGTNLSRVNNYPDYTKGLDPFNFKPPVQDTTIFELLDDAYPAGKTSAPFNWNIYYHDAPVSALCQYVYNSMESSYPNVSPFFGDFAAAVANDMLPKYAFIEPSYATHPDLYLTANSNHPGGAILPQNDPYNAEDLPPPVDVRDGERLLCDVYSALLAYPEVFKKTLLIVTYDEHGGLFDHVGPPKAKSPFSPPVDNFDYDRYGVRVPAILINPYIKPGTVYPPRQPYGPVPNPPFDHTSILRTLIEQFNLGKNMLSPILSYRVQSAPPISGIISETYTPPPPCPAIPSGPAAPTPRVPAAPPPRPPGTAPRAHSLASALVPLYRYIELKGGPRRP
jgi:phospholipase C